MRIDFVITDLAVGGAEIQAVLLLERLIQNGHQVRLISLLPPVAFHDRLEQAGIPVCSLGMRSYATLPLALFRLLKLFQESPPDIVHGHMVHANLLVRLSRLFWPKPKIICTAHNITEGGALRDWAYRLTNGLSHLNTTVSESATRRFIEQKVFSPRNTHTVFNGIDLEVFFPADKPSGACGKGAFVWIAVGRLVAQKDYPTLLEAFARLKQGKLLIAGDGALKESLLARVAQLGLAPRVTFLGARHDLPELYRKADGFVLSSEWEGYGLVVAEAMASGLPAVVTESGGPAEIVGRDGRAGLVVPVKDPAALAEAMNQIMAMPLAERNTMGQCGRERIQATFAIEKIVFEWEKTYRLLLTQTNYPTRLRT